MEATTIHETVREHYGELARASSSCCSSGSSSSALYDEQLIQAVPTDISGFSLGCGDPITLAKLQPGETVLDLGSGGGLDCFLAAKQVGERGHVIGVDMTPDMLNKARANAGRLKVQNVEFREGYLEVGLRIAVWHAVSRETMVIAEAGAARFATAVISAFLAGTVRNAVWNAIASRTKVVHRASATGAIAAIRTAFLASAVGHAVASAASRASVADRASATGAAAAIRTASFASAIGYAAANTVCRAGVADRAGTTQPASAFVTTLLVSAVGMADGTVVILLRARRIAVAD